MMACIADSIVAAPFAIIGSIGVVASLPNLNKFLKKHDVDYLEITAGEYKRTLTPLGEITDEKMKKFKEQIEDVHELFKDHVSQHRANVDIAKVSTGEYWYGSQAKELNLVDEIGTSDDFLLRHKDSHNLIEVKFEGKKTLREKISEGMEGSMERMTTKALTKLWSSRFQ